MPHRLLRLRLVGLLIVVLTGQVSGLPVSMVQAWGLQGRADVSTCCCCRRGSAGRCQCSRAPHVSARCTCGCQGHRDAAVPPLLDLEAVVPSSTTVFANRVAVGAPIVAASRFAEYSPIPPSPPPWSRPADGLL